MAVVYIGLGSNMNNPKQQLMQAKKSLQELNNTKILACSDLYQSAAMTMPDDNEPQDDYINAVLKLQTELSPHQLLDECQSIENNQARVRLKRWGARTLDIDILMYDQLQLHDERLSLPHPGMTERNFVLYPLRQIEKNIVIPGQAGCQESLQKIPLDKIQNVGLFE